MGSFYPELWGAKTLEAVLRSMKERKYIVSTITDYTNFVKDKAASGYHGPRVGVLETKDLPYTDPFQTAAKTAVKINFDQKKGVPFVVSDIDEAQSNINILKECTESAKDAIIDGWDDFIIRALIVGAASANKITLADTVNKVMTKADFQEARLILNKKGAPMRERYAVLSPEHESQLYDISEFISRDKIAKTEAIQEGVIGRLFGFDILLHPAMPKVNDSGDLSSTQNKEVSIFYSKAAYGFGRQKVLGTKTSPDAGLPGDKINIYTVFGGVIQEEDMIITIRDHSSENGGEEGGDNGGDNGTPGGFD